MHELRDDIIKYKKGLLSPKEMHALEKRALSDPFLADALEGGDDISADDFERDVTEINRKIAKGKKTIWFTPLRIAAGVILIVGSVFMVYQLVPKQETIALNSEKSDTTHTIVQAPKPSEKEEAKEVTTANKPSPAKQENSFALKTSEPKVDKLKIPVGEPTAETKPKVDDQIALADSKAQEEKKIEEVKTELKEEAPVVAMQPVQPIALDKDLKESERAVGKTRKATYKLEQVSGAGLASKSQVTVKPISGTVTFADDSSPLPGVNVVIEGTTQGTVTDTQGNFTLQTTNEKQQLVFSFIGLQTEKVSIEGKEKIDVSLKSDATQLSEVVVAGVGRPRDDNAEMTISYAEPEGGRRAFNKYLSSNLRYPEEALKSNVKGKARVEFTVYPNGNLDGYTIVKSLGYGCDEELIRLIKDGPKWSPTTENGRPVESKVRVGLKFDPAKSIR